jgi:hypothetical protein
MYLCCLKTKERVVGAHIQKQKKSDDRQIESFYTQRTTLALMIGGRKDRRRKKNEQRQSRQTNVKTNPVCVEIKKELRGGVQSPIRVFFLFSIIYISDDYQIFDRPSTQLCTNIYIYIYIYISSDLMAKKTQ